MSREFTIRDAEPWLARAEPGAPRPAGFQWGDDDWAAVLAWAAQQPEFESQTKPLGEVMLALDAENPKALEAMAGSGLGTVGVLVRASQRTGHKATQAKRAKQGGDASAAARAAGADEKAYRANVWLAKAYTGQGHVKTLAQAIKLVEIRIAEIGAALNTYIEAGNEMQARFERTKITNAERDKLLLTTKRAKAFCAGKKHP